MNVTCARCGASNENRATFCASCGYRLTPSTATGALAAHTLLNGRYEITERIGGGGMGAVYRAFDFQQDRVVAVKEMSDQALGPGRRDQAVEQFRREALLLQTLSHPNLVKVTDTFSDGRRHYLVMDFVDGRPLASLLASQPSGREDLARGWAGQLCDVLGYLHSRQPPVIFRDLKPDNILLATGSDQLKLVDFGIARFFDPAKEHDTVAVGTRGYMAPEAFYGQTDPRSDLYSLGVTLHTLLSGYDPAQSPWQLPPLADLAPQVTPDLIQIVTHAIELDPDARFQTAQEFKRALGGEVALSEAVEVEAAPAAPVAARVSTARPVRFNGREQITSLAQIVALSSRHWDALVNHLRVGELEVWLDLLGETDLARYARDLRQESSADMNVQMQLWLQATGQAPAPQLAVSPLLVNLGTVNSRTPLATRVRLRNRGQGLLIARLDSETPWLAPGISQVAANDQVVPVWVYGDRLPQGAPAEGRIQIRSNGGDALVSVRLRPSLTARATVGTRPPAWAGSVLSALAVVGGLWAVSQLTTRLHLPPVFDVRAWLEGSQGWLLLPLAAIVLTLAALLGNTQQWERLAADAPFSEWLGTASWLLGATFFAILGASLLLTALDAPAWLLQSGQTRDLRLPIALPLLAGGAAAFMTASAWATGLRQRAGGSLVFMVLLSVGVGLTLAGALGGAWLAAELARVLPQTLPGNTAAGVIMVGALLGVGLAMLGGGWIGRERRRDA